MKWFPRLFVFLVVALMRVGVFAAPAVTNLPENRILLFNDYTSSNTAVLVDQPWVLHDGPLPVGNQQTKKALLPGTNHFHRTGWRLLSCRTGSAAYLGNSVPPKVPESTPVYPSVASNLAANLRYDLGAMVESPVLTNGAGTLYFEAINNLVAYPGQINVEIATNMVDVGSGAVVPTVLPPTTNDLDYIWVTNDVVLLNAATTNDFIRCVRLLNFRGPIKLRIRRTGVLDPGVTDRDVASVIIDNIRVSPPPSDVVIYNPSAFQQAGKYTLRCFIDNADTNAPTDSRTVIAYYRWLNLAQPFTNSPMTRVYDGDGQGNGERYELNLPEQPLGGDLAYYVVCGFSGYMYQSPDYTARGYTNYLAESLSPFTLAAQTQHLAASGWYALTVDGGSGDGVYTNGQQVAIAASNMAGKAFERWTGATQHVADATAPATTLTMPDADVTVAAAYTNVSYALTVNGGSGGGTYAYEQQVPIVADPPAAGMRFFRWEGNTAGVADIAASNTVVTMPASSVVLTATYIDVHTLTVNDGSGSGSYTNGEKVAISANAAPNGKIFYRWTGQTAYVSDVSASNAVVTMPGVDVELTASYIDVYTLTVNSGSGSGGTYTNGQKVAISANAPLSYQRFDRWTGNTAYVADINASNTVVTMPAADVEVTATYVNIYALTVTSGSGDGSYVSGQHVPITADPPAVGKTFAVWTGATQYVADVTASSTLVTMPAFAIGVTATYTNAYYSLTVSGGTGGGAFTNGHKTSISATVPGGKTFEKWTGDTAYVASVTSLTTTVTMPAFNISVSALFSSVTTNLPDGRFLHFNDYTSSNTAVLVDQPWVLHQGPLPVGNQQSKKALLPGTNHFHRTGWRLFSCRTGSAAYIAGGFSIPPISPASVPTYPAVASNLTANLRYDLGAMIESPIFTNGVGTIYFDAVTNNVDYPGELTVEFATNIWDIGLGNLPLAPPTSEQEYDWHPLDVLDLATTTGSPFTRYVRTVNYRGDMILRIRRTGTLDPGVSDKDSSFIVIDNIRVSLPPSDVVISKTEAPFEPGYPGVSTNLKVRCVVSNADMNAPTDSRTPKVVYRWRFLNQVVQAWRTNTMTYVEGTGDGQGNGEVYEASLSQSPYSDVGDLEYYYFCEFGGYLYQSPDYTGLNYRYPSENLSPHVYRGDSEGHEFTVRLRPYASKYNKLYVVADTNQFASPIEMTVVGDQVWRGMVPIAGTGITNLIWRFKAEGEYVPESGMFSTGVTYWAGVSGVTGGRLPYGGMCVETNESGSLSVSVDEGNYVLLTLNTDTLQYSATRGEYQNFNLWPAPPNAFSESNGQDPKHSYLNTFDSWPTNKPRTYLQAFAGYPPTTNVYSRDPFFTLAPEFVAGSAAYISERTLVDNTVNAPTNVLKFRNVAMRLKGGDGSLGLGYIYNRVATLPDGLKEVAFKGRIAQTSDNYDISYYRYGFTNKNYLVRGYPKVVSDVGLSPHNPSVSLVGYYRDPDNFYEYRVTQINDPLDTIGSKVDRYIRHELFKWKDGVATRLGSPVDQATTSSPLVNGYLFELCFFNETGGTRVKCRFASADKINIVDGTAPHDGGSFGYLSSDCASSLYAVELQGTLTGAIGSGSVFPALRTDTSFDADVAAWYLPSGRYVAKNNVSPKGIYSVIPTQQIGVYVQPTDYDPDGEGAQPEGAGSLAWKLYKTSTLTNYTYQTVTIPVNSWQSQFVMLQVLGGSADVAVDEFSVTSWHGQRNGLGWTDISEWVAYESWVVSNATAEIHTVYLDHSRGDPAEDQSIRSLLLETGLGQMEFDYRVLRAPAKLTVQYAPKRDITDWKEVESFVITNTTGWLHASAYLGTNAPGYFRLLNAREGIYTNAWVEINDATVWDEPTVTNNSWRAYNVKITSTDTNRVALDESKACFLNNSTQLETDPPQTQFEPFLRSPELPKGLGTLSFYARAYTNNQAATLFLYASTNGWNAPTNLWFEVTRFENITNGLYKLFTYAPVDGRDFDAIMLGTKTRAIDRRVCVEDVTISEPVFPGFDIVNVQLMDIPSGDTYNEYSQPIEGQEVHVQARIDNIHLSPSNIQMYVSYYVGSNHWGIGSWPAGEVVTRRMVNNVPGDPTLYRTVPKEVSDPPSSQNGGIVGQDKDQVVQYYVWAEYDGGIHLREEQEIFVNPSWYYPIDLNAQYAHLGWSPYYFVYGVPLDAVWINEVNAVDYVEVDGVPQSGIWNNSYIEIAIPAWMDLGGWSVEVVQYDYQPQVIRIPYGLPEQTAVTNGYAFFVIGDADQPKPGVPALKKVDYAHPGLANMLPSILPGGLRLKRPLGMYEQTSAYDYTNSWGGIYSGADWAANDPEKQFVYVGMENYGGSLGVTNASGQSFSDWTFPMYWTPGDPNVGQKVPDGTQLLPGVSNVLITSLMNLDKATQNGKRVTNYTLKMRKGMSTNIVYRTDPWYRLFSVMKNQVEQLPSLGTETNYNLMLPDLQGDVGVAVDVRLRQDLSEQGLDSDVLNWVLSFEDGELVPMYYNDRQLSLTEQFWLDANPTRSNTFELVISKFDIDPGTNFHVTVKMALNGDKMTHIQGPAVLKLQAKNRLLDTTWKMLAQYSLTADSFDANNTCRVFVPNPFDYVLEGFDPEVLFYRWMIELNDPRDSIKTLTNDPEP